MDYLMDQNFDFHLPQISFNLLKISKHNFWIVGHTIPTFKFLLYVSCRLLTEKVNELLLEAEHKKLNGVRTSNGLWAHCYQFDSTGHELSGVVDGQRIVVESESACRWWHRLNSLRMSLISRLKCSNVQFREYLIKYLTKLLNPLETVQ